MKYLLKDWVHTSLSMTHSTFGMHRLLSAFGRDGWWLAGGSVMSLVSNKRHDGDYDIFFKNELVFRAFELFLINNFNARKVFASKNAVSYQVGTETVQLIHRKFYEDVTELFKDFDFTISMFALDYENNIYCGNTSVQDLKDKKIIILHINALGETFKRVIKFGKKGFKIPNITYAKLISLFSEYNILLNDYKESENYEEGYLAFDKQIPNGGISFHDEDDSIFTMKDSLQTIPFNNANTTTLANSGSSNYT